MAAVTVTVLGTIVSLLGAALVVRSALILAGRGRPRRGPTPALVIAGPYLRVRNPLLAGTVLAAGGLACAGGSLGLGVATVVLAGVAHLWVVRIEEPRLRARFGTAYARYLSAVPRWVPRPRRDTAGEEGPGCDLRAG